MAGYKVVEVEAVKKFLKKVGVEADIPEEGKVSFAVRKKDNEVVVVVKGKEKHEIFVPLENYDEYLKYGKVGGRPARDGSRYGPRGAKTKEILNAVKKILEKDGKVRMGKLWKDLEGTVKHRPYLYQVVRKYCEFEYVQNGNRKEMVITGVKKF